MEQSIYTITVNFIVYQVKKSESKFSEFKQTTQVSTF